MLLACEPVLRRVRCLAQVSRDGTGGAFRGPSSCHQPSRLHAGASELLSGFRTLRDLRGRRSTWKEAAIQNLFYFSAYKDE